MTKKLNYKKLPKKTKKIWLEALRSGEYTQGREQLRRLQYPMVDGIVNDTVEPTGECFCCLGVLADVALVGEWDEEKFTYKGKRYSCDLDCDFGEYHPDMMQHGDALEDLGLDGYAMEKLIKFNDGKSYFNWQTGERTWEKKPKTFKQIAAWIEKNL